MSILEVQHLTKTYPAFTLRDVSFALEPGKITGFIGRNGAGKTTTMKSILNFVHPDCGEIRFFGLPFPENELAVKRRIGFVSGGVDYYSTKKLRAITAVTRRLYAAWDEQAYRRWLTLFSLDENKTPAQLSAGMRVKYSIALALSHNAELLILDEPTSGLDPVSREDLLDVFLDLSEKGVTILFSTHITTDLERCADNILYIKNGEIRAEAGLDAFLAGYRMATLGETVPDAAKPLLIGCKRSKHGHEALVRAADVEALCAADAEARLAPADLSSVMVHIEKEGEE